MSILSKLSKALKSKDGDVVYNADKIKNDLQIHAEYVDNLNPCAIVFKPKDDISFYGESRGFVFGDSFGRFSDGSYIRTSSIEKRVDIFKNVYIIETRNSCYLICDMV